jgi:hypothetical protein
MGRRLHLACIAYGSHYIRPVDDGGSKPAASDYYSDGRSRINSGGMPDREDAERECPSRKDEDTGAGASRPLRSLRYENLPRQGSTDEQRS